jgi:hypothetical protein
MRFLERNHHESNSQNFWKSTKGTMLTMFFSSEVCQKFPPYCFKFHIHPGAALKRKSQSWVWIYLSRWTHLICPTPPEEGILPPSLESGKIAQFWTDSCTRSFPTHGSVLKQTCGLQGPHCGHPNQDPNHTSDPHSSKDWPSGWNEAQWTTEVQEGHVYQKLHG